jgi:hypothetical protein
MKKSEALPGNYLRQEDVSEPMLVTIERVTLEVLENDRGKDNKPIMYFGELGRGLVVNATNWDACEIGFSEVDSDGWIGRKVVLFVDPTVTFGSKRVGGIRIRMPKQRPASPDAPTPEEVAEEAKAAERMYDTADEVPF